MFLPTPGETDRIESKVDEITPDKGYERERDKPFLESLTEKYRRENDDKYILISQIIPSDVKKNKEGNKLPREFK